MSNLAAKGGMDLGDKRLDDGITYVMPSLDGVLAGSAGASEDYATRASGYGRVILM